jgi:hypothetical protein
MSNQTMPSTMSSLIFMTFILQADIHEVSSPPPSAWIRLFKGLFWLQDLLK